MNSGLIPPNAVGDGRCTIEWRSMVRIPRFEQARGLTREYEAPETRPPRLWPEANALLSDLMILPPPYVAPSSLALRASLPSVELGSIIAAQGTSGVIVPLAALTIAAERWPWAVPYLVMPIRSERLTMPLRIVSELRDRLVIGEKLTPPPPDVAALGAAVRRRGIPAPEKLAAWVGRRLNEPILEPILFSQFRISLEGSGTHPEASNSTYSRFFARLGPLTARDWRAVARLCVHASAGERETLPASSRIAMRTAIEYTRRYLGITYRELSLRLGWEWIFESTLRRAGYI